MNPTSRQPQRTGPKPSPCQTACFSSLDLILFPVWPRLLGSSQRCSQSQGHPIS